jgi:site-specific DNA recombinase
MSTIIQTSTAVGYFRVSTPDQAGERHVSLDVQKERFEGFCKTHGLFAVQTFTDVASGRKDDRVQYQAMLSYVGEHGVNNVVVLFLDRFGRNPREILRRYWDLQERGITIQSVSEDLREELLLLVRAGMAGAESRRTSERVSAAMRRIAEGGKVVGKLPYGFQKVWDGSKARIEQAPAEVEVIRRAYQLAVEENRGFLAIANELNRLGYRTQAGRPFSSQGVKQITGNPALVGHLWFKGAIAKEGVYPAILTPEEWERLQQRFAIRREGRARGRTHTSAFLLSGVVRCSHCGGAMTGQVKRGYNYYLCAQSKKARALCAYSVYHRMEPLEAAILEYLGQYSDPDKVRELLQAQDTQADTRQEQELTRVTARLKELETGMLNDLDRLDRKVITEAEYTKRAEVRRQEQPALQALKEELETGIAAQRDREAQAKAVPVKVRSFLADFQGMEVVKAKAILQTIVKAAHVWKDGKIELEFR